MVRAIVILIVIALISFTTISIILVPLHGKKDGHLIEEKREFEFGMYTYFGISFLLLFFMLGLSIVILIWRLKMKQKEFEKSCVPNVFGKEIWSLIIILVTFCTSFLLRYLYDEFISLKYFISEDNKIKASKFTTYMVAVALQYAWDYIPVGAIVWFHHHNFSKKVDNISKVDITQSYEQNT